MRPEERQPIYDKYPEASSYIVALEAELASLREQVAAARKALHMLPIMTKVGGHVHTSGCFCGDEHCELRRKALEDGNGEAASSDAQP